MAYKLHMAIDETYQEIDRPLTRQADTHEMEDIGWCAWITRTVIEDRYGPRPPRRKRTPYHHTEATVPA